MARAWPLADVPAADPLVEAEDATASAADGQIAPTATGCPSEQAQAILDLRLQRLTALERDKLTDELQRDREQDRRAAADPALARAPAGGDEGASCSRIKELFDDAAAHLHRPRRRARHRHRGPDPARGHGRHRHPQGLDQARAPGLVPRAAPRRQGQGRHAHPRRRFRRPDVRAPARTRRCCSSPASAGSTSSRSTACRWARPQARGRAMINMFPALSEGENITAVMPLPEDESALGDDGRVLRHRQRQGPPQRARRLHLRAQQRQDRHGPRRGRPTDRGRGLRRQPRHPARGRSGGRAIRFPVDSRARVQVAQLRGRATAWTSAEATR